MCVQWFVLAANIVVVVVVVLIILQICNHYCRNEAADECRMCLSVCMRAPLDMC